MPWLKKYNMAEKIEFKKGEHTIVFYPNSHRYKLKGEKTYLLSPSSIVGMLDKSKPLMIWAERLTNDFVKQYLEDNGLAEMGKDDILNLVQAAASQHSQQKDQAADVGTFIHDYAEAFANYKLGKCACPEVPDIETAMPHLPASRVNEMQEQVENGITGFLNWVKEHNVEYLHAEYFVYNHDDGYAGKTDAIVKVDGKLTLLDYKTGKRVYSSHRYQAAGYYLAVQHDAIHPEQTAILLFNKETGEFTYEVYSEDEIQYDLEVFLALLTVKKREKILSKW